MFMRNIITISLAVPEIKTMHCPKVFTKINDLTWAQDKQHVIVLIANLVAGKIVKPLSKLSKFLRGFFKINFHKNMFLLLLLE